MSILERRLLTSISRKIRNWFLRWAGLSGLDALPDARFLEEVYSRLLGRSVDETGRSFYLGSLRQGKPRLDVVMNIIQSEEFTNRVIRENMPVISIRLERPDRYRSVRDIHGRETWIFEAREAADFDWLESKIVENGYYEKPGVWSFILTEDKRLHAEIVSLFAPSLVLDFGCANGPVMKSLLDLGIPSQGVDISRLALAKAFPEVREAIHLGDLLSLELQPRFDFVLGLDIFEHLNPNKLPAYLSRLSGLLENGGFLYGNIPAIGRDEVFGEIFESYLREWEDDLKAGRLFSAVHVDAEGYPYNGHVIAAGSDWWTQQFESLGFRREAAIESALHRKYDQALKRIHVARQAFFVFSKNADPRQKERLLQRLPT